MSLNSTLDINNKDIRDANKVGDDSDDEGESMDWWSKYFASLDKLIMVKFIETVNNCQFRPLALISVYFEGTLCSYSHIH